MRAQRAEIATPALAAGDADMLFAIADGKVVYANRKAEEALRIGPDQPLSPAEVFRMVAVAPEFLHLSQESLRRRSRGEDVPPVECALLTRDGRRIEGVLTSKIVERQGRREPLGIFTDKKPQAGF